MYPPLQTRNNRASLLKILAALVAVTISQIAFALEGDRFQPIDVAADSAVLDDKAGKATYRGNVLLTQGTLKIQADQLTIETGAEGKVEKVIATGNLARFEQTPNKNEKPIEARANTVEYYVASEKIVLIENARVVQNDNLFEGNVIEYDIREQKLQARGKVLTTDENADTDQPGRVKMVLQPQTEKAEATPPTDAKSESQADLATEVADPESGENSDSTAEDIPGSTTTQKTPQKTTEEAAQSNE